MWVHETATRGPSSERSALTQHVTGGTCRACCVTRRMAVLLQHDGAMDPFIAELTFIPTDRNPPLMRFDGLEVVVAASSIDVARPTAN